MPYMECQFQTLTGISLKGLSQFTGWIKPGSYYHGVVAKKGQLHFCLHLAGTVLPRGPQIRSSQTEALTQKKEETPRTSHPTLEREGSVTQGACSDPPLPMETGGAGVEQAEKECRRDRPAKHHRSSPRRRGSSLARSIPYHSRIPREGMRPYSSSTGMQVSTPRLVMMWLPREWPATILIWSRA